MKPILIVVEKDNNNLILTKEELQSIIDQVYEEGFNDGNKNASNSWPYKSYKVNLTSPEYNITHPTVDTLTVTGKNGQYTEPVKLDSNTGLSSCDYCTCSGIGSKDC